MQDPCNFRWFNSWEISNRYNSWFTRADEGSIKVDNIPSIKQYKKLAKIYGCVTKLFL